MDRAAARPAVRTAPDIARQPRSVDRSGSSRDVAGISRDRQTRSVTRTTTETNRSVSRTVSAARPDGSVRTAAFRDRQTVARGVVGGRDVTIRTTGRYQNRPARSRDIYVMNAGYHRPHWPYGDYRPYRYPGYYRPYGPYRPYGWYRPYGYFRPYAPYAPYYYPYNHVNVSVGFTFVSSYYAPAGAVFYDVVPVAPVVYTPPTFSLSFAYVRHHGIAVSAIRYVEPVYYAPPTMVVYPTVYSPPIITPVVFSPIVPAPIVAPVAVPVMTPVYGPMYYYQPAYAYYPVYTAMVAPTYVVEPAPAPVVVEEPASSWSISTAFSFAGRHGNSFGVGGTFTKRKPATVLVPGAASVAQAQTPEAQSADVSMETGLAAIRTGEMDKAGEILTQVILSDPDNGMARMLYTAALMADGKYKDATESLRRSLETWPDFELKDFYLPSVYDDAKVFTKTVRDVREFLSDHPERDDAWLLVAWSYAVSGQTSEANLLLNEARKSWPDDATLALLDKSVQANEAAEQATAAAQ